MLTIQEVDSPDQILLVPIDSRPAVSQFPVWIGRIADINVLLPPEEILGRFTKPGHPAAIAEWLLKQDLSKPMAAIISADMIAYGGLIQSRVIETSQQLALSRLQIFRKLREANASLPVYACSALMRTAPTATNETTKWRLNLARYVELRDRYRRTGDPSLINQLDKHRSVIPDKELERYEETRKRNMVIHKHLIKLTKEGVIDYLVIGADDAQEYGPHYQEMQELRLYARSLEIEGRVYFCEGVDQHANLLLSRAALRNKNWIPKVYVRLSDPHAGKRLSTYESQPLEVSIRDQIIASGGRPETNPKSADYTLYLNAPGTDPHDFDSFALSLIEEANGETHVAVADINFGKDGSGDERLMRQIWNESKSGNLLAFAGWNTAGNTLGTAIPHANIVLLGKRIERNPVRRELAQREFILHRLVNDYGYHRWVRPAAFELVDKDPYGTREEAYGQAFDRLQSWVARNTRALLERYFNEHFKGVEFLAGGDKYRITGLRDVRISLPWPRAFEVRIDYAFEYELLTIKSLQDFYRRSTKSLVQRP